MKQSLAEVGAGLMLGLRGLLDKELRSRSRGWRGVWLLTGYLLCLSLAIVGFLALFEQVGGTIPANLGIQLFSSLALGAVLLLAFITPALTAGAISGERERRTLDLLLVTRATALGVVSGKLLASLFYILFLLVASLPSFALVYLFGGVPPSRLLMVMAVAVATALAHASLGLLLSAVLKRTILASVVAYVIVLGLVFGLPFVSAILTLARQGDFSGPPPISAYASPLLSLASVLPTGTMAVGLPLVGDILRLLVGGGREVMALPSTAASLAQTVYVVRRDPMTGQPETIVLWAPWVYHFLFCAAFTLLSVIGATLALAPVKPWQGWRARVRRPLASTSGKA